MAGNDNNYIKAWRQFHGLSQRDLVAALKETQAPLSTGSLSRLEAGRQSYSVQTLAAISTVLKCEPWQLLAGPPGRDETENLAAMMKIVMALVVRKHFDEGNIEALLEPKGVDDYWLEMAGLVNFGLTILKRGGSVDDLLPSLGAYAGSGDPENPAKRRDNG